MQNFERFRSKNFGRTFYSVEVGLLLKQAIVAKFATLEFGTSWNKETKQDQRSYFADVRDLKTWDILTRPHPLQARQCVWCANSQVLQKYLQTWIYVLIYNYIFVVNNLNSIHVRNVASFKYIFMFTFSDDLCNNMFNMYCIYNNIIHIIFYSAEIFIFVHTYYYISGPKTSLINITLQVPKQWQSKHTCIFQ